MHICIHLDKNLVLLSICFLQIFTRVDMTPKIKNHGIKLLQGNFTTLMFYLVHFSKNLLKTFNKPVCCVRLLKYMDRQYIDLALQFFFFYHEFTVPDYKEINCTRFIWSLIIWVSSHSQLKFYT